MVAIGSHLEVLSQAVHRKGGWGYAVGQSAHPEPTCLAMLALSLDPVTYQEPINQGWQFLRNCAKDDGSYALPHGRVEAIWPTSLVLFVQAALGGPRSEMEATATRLLALRGRSLEQHQADEIHDIDLSLVGWPWASGNFSWAEPTAWACLALRRAGFGDHPRVAEGLRLLLDRTMDSGGINYGNRRILGRATEPIPSPSALLLLAMQDQPFHPRIAATLDYLKQHALLSNDLEHLCWAKLALSPYRHRPGVGPALAVLNDRINAAYQVRQHQTWLRPSIIREALTALALASEQKHLFLLPGSASHAPSAAVPLQPVAYLSDSAATDAAISPKRRPFLERIKSAVRGWTIEAVGHLRMPPTETAVHIAAVTDYGDDLAGIMEQQYAAFRERVPLGGKRVVLKPNLVEYHRDKVINTHPRVVGAVVEMCRRAGAAEVIVAEGPGHWRNVEYLVEASGLGDVLRQMGVSFVDLNHDDPVQVTNLGRLTGLDDLYLPRTIVSADVLISLPKLKTHHWAGATLSLKNLFGMLPGICYGWPKNELHWRGIDNSIVDIALTRTPDLAIVDGIVGMEGDGPLNGIAKPLGALVMGCDALAVDATCCRLMCLDPEKVAHLALAYRKKLGLLRSGEIRQIGHPLEGLAKPFATVSHHRQLCLGRSA